MPTVQPTVQQDEDIKSLTFAVGRLAGAVEAQTSRLNRTDDFIDTHFRELNAKFDSTVTPIVSRVTIIEAQRGRFAWPTASVGALIGALVSAFTTHFLGKVP